MRYSVLVLTSVAIVAVTVSGCCHLRRVTRGTGCVSEYPAYGTIVAGDSNAVIADSPDEGVIAGSPPAEPVVVPSASAPATTTIDVFGDAEYEPLRAGRVVEGGVYYPAPSDR